MTLEKKQLRYGHSEGHTDVCYQDNGEHLLTCGSDGDLRIWKDIDDEDPQTIGVGDLTRTVAVKNGRVYTNADNNTVQALTFPEGLPDGIITRFTAPVNHLSLSPSGDLLLAGSDDFHVKLVTVEDRSSQKVFVGHEAPILSVALDPKAEYIASSSCDGHVKVWKTEDQSCVQSWPLLTKCSDVSISKTLCRLSFQPGHGKYLAVPVEKSIHVYERDNWKQVCRLQDERIQHPLSISLWSLDGDHVVGVSVDGGIYVWNWTSKQCVQFVQHDKKLTICGIAFHPQGKNEVAYTDREGQLGIIENILPTSSGQVKPVEDDQNQFTDLFDDNQDDAEFMAAADAIEHLHSNRDRASNFINDEAEEDDDDDDMGNLVSQKPKHRSVLRIQDDENSMDSTSKGPSSIVSESDTEKVVAEKPPVYTGPQFVPLQRAFQPSATPVHLSSRFMVWNSVGIIKAYSTDDEHSIEIEFHDTSLHHAMHTDNTVGYTMAAMSTEAVVLAAESQDSDTPSQLLCLHFSSWDNQKEWSTTMPKGEDIKAVTVGYGWLASATNKRLVHLFSIGGFQQQVISIPGPVVCLAGHGNQLLVVYHMATGIPGDQCLGVKLLCVSGRQHRVISGDQLPLSPQSTLVWMGFSAEGTPVCVDSHGIVRILNRGMMSWCPVANTRSKAKSRSDHFWVVGVHECPLQLRCVPCKGSTFPPTLPRPAVAVLEFQLPLCELNAEKGKYEEEYWRNHYFSRHFKYNESQGYEIDKNAEKEAQQEINNALMKLFALACKSDRDFRGGEIAESMSSEHSISLAIKYASRMKKLSLAQYLSQLAHQKAEEETAAAMATEDAESNYRSYGNSLDAVYSHTETEWSTQGSVQTQEDDEDNEEMEHTGRIEKSPILKPKKVTATRSITCSQGRKNPFKVTREKESSPSSPQDSDTKGTTVLDNMTKMAKKPKNRHLNLTEAFNSEKSPPKQSQPTLFQLRKKPSHGKHLEGTGDDTAKKPVSAFQFWLQENKRNLSEEHPDLEEAEVMKIATQTWRKLSMDQKQEWSEKAKTQTDEGQDTTPAAKKRKRKEENDAPSKKQTLPRKDVETGKVSKVPLSSATNTKLAGFAFQKD